MANYVILGVLSGIVFGFADVATKLALKARDSRVVVLGAFIWAALFWAPLISLARLGLSPVAIEEHLFAQKPVVHALIFVKALFLVLSSTAAFAAVKALPITISSALRATGPLFVLGASLVVLGTLPTSLESLGILTGVVSLLIYSWSGKNAGPSELRPRYAALMLLAVLMAALSLVVDKVLIAEYAVNARSIQFLADLYRVGVALVVYWGLMRVAIGRADVFAPTVIAAGILMSLGEFVYFLGLEIPGSQIAVLSMLRKFSLLVVFAAGIIFFREKSIPRKAVGLVLLMSSLVFIRASG